MVDSLFSECVRPRVPYLTPEEKTAIMEERTPHNSLPPQPGTAVLSTLRQCPSPGLLKCPIYRPSLHGHTKEGSGTLLGPEVEILSTDNLPSPKDHVCSF